MEEVKIKFQLLAASSLIRTAKWARLRDDTLLVSNDSPYVTDDFISLKDVSYAIDNGMLYIKGTRIYWDKIQWYYDSIGEWDPWSHRFIQFDDFKQKHEVPETCIRSNLKKRVWFIFHRTYDRVIDTSLNEHGKYFKRKLETPFNCCIHPFKLYE
jgi:hypothetical protein